MTEYDVAYEQADDGSWSVHAVGLPVFSVGDSKEEAEREIRKAIALYLESLEDDGKPTPDVRTSTGSVTV